MNQTNETRTIKKILAKTRSDSLPRQKISRGANCLWVEKCPGEAANRGTIKHHYRPLLLCSRCPFGTNPHNWGPFVEVEYMERPRDESDTYSY